jgi:O-antigen/teichoic acid export membrane protein
MDLRIVAQQSHRLDQILEAPVLDEDPRADDKEDILWDTQPGARLHTVWRIEEMRGRPHRQDRRVSAVAATDHLHLLGAQHRDLAGTASIEQVRPRQRALHDPPPEGALARDRLLGNYCALPQGFVIASPHQWDRKLARRNATRTQRKPLVSIDEVRVGGHQPSDLRHIQPEASRQRSIADRQLGDAASDRADLKPIGRVGELATGHEVVAGDRDTVTAFHESRSQLEHQPDAAPAPCLSADVMVDERDMHLKEPTAAVGPLAACASRLDADGPISSARMVSTLPADGDPALAGSSENVHVDILDTSAAGPSVIKGSMLRVGGYGLGTLATVISSAVVIRHLGVIDTGHFLTVTALVTIVATISDLGLTGFAVREYATEPRAQGRRFLRNLLGIRIALAFGGLLLAVLFGVLVGYPTVMVVGTAIAGLGMMVLVVQDGCSIPLQVRLRFGWVAGLQLAIQVGVAIEAVLLVLAGARLLPFFALQLPVVIPVLIATAAIGGHDSRLRPALDIKQWRRMVLRILPFSGAVVLSVVYFQIAQVMVSLLSSPTQTGYFGVSFRVLMSFTTLPPLLVSTSLPLLSRAARDDAQRFDYAGRRLVETMAIAGCGLALALFLGAAFAIRVIAGPGFEQSVEVLRILALALLGTFVIGARGYALLSLDRLRAMLVCNAIALVVVLACGIPLIEVYGAKGAAIAMVAAELTLAFCYERSLTLGRPQLRLRWNFVMRGILATLLAGALASALPVSSFAAAAIGSALYLGALLALGIVPEEIVHALFKHRHTT